MARDFKGTVLYANGRAIADVRVRVFDKDAPGKGDDDLTVEEGVSDELGGFTLRFAPSKFLDVSEVAVPGLRNLPFDWTKDTLRIRLPDLTDIYLPYLQFSYTFKGQPRTHTAFLTPFKHEFRLPEMPPLKFKPSVNGLKFVNSFPGYFLPFSIPALPDIPSVSNVYGLCGGMSATSYDFLLADRGAPKNNKAPKRGSRLHRYIYKRQNDSFGTFGDQIVRFARWMALPDDTPHGTQEKTYEEFEAVRAKLDDDNCVPIGLVYISARDSLQIWENHQVLAFEYSAPDDAHVDMRIYDPNYPLRDDVYVRCERVTIEEGAADKPPLFGLRCMQRVGDRDVRPVRGFFAMPYVPVPPPPQL